MKISTLTLGGALAGALALATIPAESALYVYEGFQYNAVNDSIIGNPDDPGVTDIQATGLSGTWANGAESGAEVKILSGNLGSGGTPSFSGLATNGNHIGATTSANQGSYDRAISASIGSGSDLWFSFLVRTGTTGGAQTGGFAITTDSLNTGQIYNNNGISATFEGFGVGSDSGGSGDFQPHAWDGGTQSTTGTTFNPTVGQDYLIVGHIKFDDAGNGGQDVYNLYEYTGAVGTGTLVQIGSTVLVDVDQSQLDVVSFTRRHQMRYDELRMADNLNEALGLPIPEPSSLALIAMGGILIARRRRG